ncbi:hypothetical protein M885DRAFT_542771 [Pelagophyceae sp. CCMP2097]|nr:hypothetical protein M885DRAFT_542771 [Pelagophyceae sp. CCMP2097]
MSMVARRPGYPSTASALSPAALAAVVRCPSVFMAADLVALGSLAAGSWVHPGLHLLASVDLGSFDSETDSPRPKRRGRARDAEAPEKMPTPLQPRLAAAYSGWLGGDASTHEALSPRQRDLAARAVLQLGAALGALDAADHCFMTPPTRTRALFIAAAPATGGC